MLLSLILSLILRLCMPQHTKEYNNLQPFHQISINGSFKTKIEQGNKYSVLLVGDEKIIEDLLVKVSGKELVLNTPKNEANYSEIEVTVITPDLNSFICNRASIVHIAPFAVKDIQGQINGTSAVRAEIKAQNLDIKLAGASSLSITEKSTTAHTQLSGASVLKGYELEVESLKTELSGASKLQITISKDIEAALSGAAKLQYKGSPTIKKQQISSAAKLEQIK